MPYAGFRGRTPAFLEALEAWALTGLPIIFMGLIVVLIAMMFRFLPRTRPPGAGYPLVRGALTREGLAPASGEDPVPAAD